MAARDEERQRLAREIHDDLGAELTALRFALARLGQLHEDTEEAANNKAFAAKGDAFRTALGHAEASLDAAFRSSRRLIDERDAPALDRSVIRQINDWVSNFAQRVDMPIGFEYKADPRLGRMDDASALALLRITQEALNNTVKHAHASAAQVKLTVLASGVFLIVSDNGKGVRQSQPCSLRSVMQTVSMPFRSRGVGLQSMRERCVALGGKLELVSRSGHGLEVRAVLPWRGAVPPERRSAPPAPVSGVSAVSAVSAVSTAPASSHASSAPATPSAPAASSVADMTERSRES